MGNTTGYIQDDLYEEQQSLSNSMSTILPWDLTQQTHLNLRNMSDEDLLKYFSFHPEYNKDMNGTELQSHVEQWFNQFIYPPGHPLYVYISQIKQEYPHSQTFSSNVDSLYSAVWISYLRHLHLLSCLSQQQYLLHASVPQQIIVHFVDFSLTYNTRYGPCSSIPHQHNPSASTSSSDREEWRNTIVSSQLSTITYEAIEEQYKKCLGINYIAIGSDMTTSHLDGIHDDVGNNSIRLHNLNREEIVLFISHPAFISLRFMLYRFIQFTAGLISSSTPPAFISRVIRRMSVTSLDSTDSPLESQKDPHLKEEKPQGHKGKIAKANIPLFFSILEDIHRNIDQNDRNELWTKIGCNKTIRDRIHDVIISPLLSNNNDNISLPSIVSCMIESIDGVLIHGISSTSRSHSGSHRIGINELLSPRQHLGNKTDAIHHKMNEICIGLRIITSLSIVGTMSAYSSIKPLLFNMGYIAPILDDNQDNNSIADTLITYCGLKYANYTNTNTNDANTSITDVDFNTKQTPRGRPPVIRTNTVAIVPSHGSRIYTHLTLNYLLTQLGMRIPLSSVPDKAVETRLPKDELFTILPVSYDDITLIYPSKNDNTISIAASSPAQGSSNHTVWFWPTHVFPNIHHRFLQSNNALLFRSKNGLLLLYK